jgi:hypothetical protein
MRDFARAIFKLNTLIKQYLEVRDAMQDWS